MSFLSWISGHDEENYQAGLEADRKNAELNRKLHDAGKLSDADYAITQQRFLASQSYDPEAEIDTAFGEGLDEGAANIRGVLAKPFELIPSLLKTLPWQVWVLGLGFLAFRLGLFDGVLKGVLTKGRR